MINFTQQSRISNRWVMLTAIFAMMFGLLTIFSGGSVLFGPVEAQTLAGNYIQFVVWFNFLAGGLYVVTAIGLWRRENWTAGLAILIAIATALVAVGFLTVVLSGEVFEMRTVGALAFRISFWVVVALVARRATSRV